MATILGDLMGVFLVNLLAILLARQVKATQATMVTATRRKTLVVNVASKSWKGWTPGQRQWWRSRF
jgi:hypothetical protein